MNIRRYQISDTEEIIELFYNTVRQINVRDYTLAQVKAWAPENIDRQKWKQRLSSLITFVVEDDAKIVGFSELGQDGHINCFYAHKDYQAKGVGKLMLARIELEAKNLALNRLYAEVSITAKSFFEKKGFKIVNPQVVEYQETAFINYVMEKFI